LEHFDKVSQVDAQLDELIEEIKEEYLYKNLASKTLRQIDN
jgi:hypothetical protein